MALMHFTIITFSPFLSVVTKGSQNSGSILSIKSTRTTLILMTAISFSFSTLVWINALGIYMTSTSLFYYASIIKENITDSVNTVGELEYSLAVKSLCLFPPAIVLPLIEPYLFYLINM